MSLQELQEYAVENNHQARMAQMEVEKARKDVQATTAIGLPQVEGNANYQNFIDRPVNLIPAEFFGGPSGEFAEVKFGTEHDLTYRIQAEQLLFDGSYFVGLKASQTYKKVSKERLEKTRSEIRKNVTDGYIQALAAQEERSTLDGLLSNFRELFRETEAMVEEGVSDETEKDQLERSVLNMENSLQDARQMEEEVKRNLKYLAGIPAADSLALKDSMLQILDRSEEAELLGQEFHPEEHIEHRVASTQVQLRDLDLQNEKADFYPKLSAFFNYQENAQRDEFNFTDTDEPWFPQTVAGVRLSMPIFNSGRKLFQAQKAKLDRVQAEIERDRVDEELKNQYRNARSDYTRAKERLVNQERAFELSGKILDRSIEKFREGTMSSLELNRVKNDHLDDRSAYIRSVRQLLQARNELKKILGIYR